MDKELDYRFEQIVAAIEELAAQAEDQEKRLKKLEERLLTLVQSFLQKKDK